MRAWSRAWASAVAGVALVAAACAPLAACGEGPSANLTVHLPASVSIDAKAIRLDPPSAARSASLVNGQLLVVADARAPSFTVSAPGLCPVTFSPSTGAVQDAAARFDVGGDRAQVGFDAPFTIDVTVGCKDAARGHVEWKQIDGLPLAQWSVDPQGLHLHARTRPMADTHPILPSWGIVPASPRTQGRYVLSATWVGDGPEVTRTVTVTSMARSTGVPSVAVGQRVLLAGAGWHVQAPPPGGRALVQPARSAQSEGGLSSFTADAGGHWMLQDGAGHFLGVRAGRFDTTPLGCGTSQCHHDEHEAIVSSPMTHALESHDTAAADGHASGGDVSCMLDCHVLGERGLHDGGFLDRASTSEWSASVQEPWQELPRTLRRLGGVGCTGCHGPGAIPERTASRAILRVDVCATCHDAPPAYTHVAEWSGSRMARSDQSPLTRASFACARCHMTAGFVAAEGAHGMRFADEDDLHADPAGIGCAACHAPHRAHQGKALVRSVTLPDELDDQGKGDRDAGQGRYGSSAVCIPCHAPVPGEKVPSASAATIWAGRSPLPLPASAGAKGPHDDVAGGCVGCHGGGKAHVDHSFRVDPASCKGCHTAGAPSERLGAGGKTVQARALALWGTVRERAKLAQDPAGATPLHAWAMLPDGTSAALSRALYEVGLVVQDPAAAVHNAPYARALLDDAEAALRQEAP